MTGYTIAWLAWIAAFVVIEGSALRRNGSGDTLSEHLRKWAGTARGTKVTPLVKLRRLALLAGLSWLTVHLMTDGQL